MSLIDKSCVFFDSVNSKEVHGDILDKILINGSSHYLIAIKGNLNNISNVKCNALTTIFPVKQVYTKK